MSHSDLKLHMKDLNSNYRALTSACNRLTACFAGSDRRLMRGVVRVEIAVMKHSLDGKIFQSIENSENGEVSSETIFHYHQNNEIVSADYKGGNIRKGHLLGKCLNGNLEFTYQHINIEGNLMLGQCISTLSVLPDGRYKYHENWQWINGDKSKGTSQIIEIRCV